MRGLYLFGQTVLFWIQCTSLFDNHRNKGPFLQWSVVPLLLLQYYKAACYDLSLVRMLSSALQNVMCFVQVTVLNFWLVSNQFTMGVWLTWSKIWTSKGAENIINWQYLVTCNLWFSYILFFSCLTNNTMNTFLRSLNALFQLHIWRNSIKTSINLLHSKVSWHKHCMYLWMIYR